MAESKLLAAKCAECIRLRTENAKLRYALAQAMGLTGTNAEGWCAAANERDRLSQLYEAAHVEREQEEGEALEKMLAVQRLLEVEKQRFKELDAGRDRAARQYDERVHELMLSLDKLRRENAKLAEDNAKLKHELRQAERSAVETLPVLLPVPMGEMGPHDNGADGG